PLLLRRQLVLRSLSGTRLVPLRPTDLLLPLSLSTRLRMSLLASSLFAPSRRNRPRWSPRLSSTPTPSSLSPLSLPIFESIVKAI
ncbi:hypothetical protein PMAYCL1PPCAC_29228, partial [Pristionchus mayeri]